MCGSSDRPCGTLSVYIIAGQDTPLASKGHLAQLAEARASKARCCRFKSCDGHRSGSRLAHGTAQDRAWRLTEKQRLEVQPTTPQAPPDTEAPGKVLNYPTGHASGRGE